MNRRPPNELEGRLHQAALSAPKKELTARQAESIIPDPTQRQNALNFLLAVGLFKGLTTSTGQLVFRAAGKEEIAATKDLSGEENLVLSHIKSSGNEGIWTKHLKAKTSLHQTVIDRCLKTLTQKRLIKRVQSVQHITRKIYMLEGIEPSISLTGGPWYTDNELDTEFIHNLTEACYKLISDISFPKRRNGDDRVLYPISNSPQYPTAEHIRNSLKKARLTETELTVEHVEMLLNVLVLDGKIERLPAFGSALWSIDDKSDEESQDENDKLRRKRKKRGDNDESSDTRAKKKKKKKYVGSSSEEDEGSSRKRSSKRKRIKGKGEDDDSDGDLDNKTKRRKTKKKSISSDESGADEQPRKKKKKRKHSDSSDASSSSSESESETKSRKNSKSSKATKRERSLSPLIGNSLFAGLGGGGSVYRALREVSSSSLGLMETPCGPCPSFEFCKDEGPVNPQECIYYSEWLSGQTLATEV